MNLSDLDTLETLQYADTSCLILILLHTGTVCLSTDFVKLNNNSKYEKNM